MGMIIGVLVFGGFSVGIWYSYRLFMRGHTADEKIDALLPSDFKPELSYRKGDTFVGYEGGTNRLVVVDCPHAKVLAPKEVLSLEPEQESLLGVTHYWIALQVPDPKFSKYRIWFQFRRAKRDHWLGELAKLRGN